MEGSVRLLQQLARLFSGLNYFNHFYDYFVVAGNCFLFVSVILKQKK
jgi:hypothetical protein